MAFTLYFKISVFSDQNGDEMEVLQYTVSSCALSVRVLLLPGGCACPAFSPLTRESLQSIPRVLSRDPALSYQPRAMFFSECSVNFYYSVGHKIRVVDIYWEFAVCQAQFWVLYALNFGNNILRQLFALQIFCLFFELCFLIVEF